MKNLPKVFFPTLKSRVGTNTFFLVDFCDTNHKNAIKVFHPAINDGVWRNTFQNTTFLGAEKWQIPFLAPRNAFHAFLWIPIKRYILNLKVEVLNPTKKFLLKFFSIKKKTSFYIDFLFDFRKFFSIVFFSFLASEQQL